MQAQPAEQVRADVQEELTTLSGSRAESLDAWLPGVKTQTRLPAERPAFRSDDTDRIRRHLSELVADGNVPDGVVAVHYYDAESGTIVTSSSDAMARVSPAEQGAPFATDPPTFDGPNDVYVSAPFRVPVVDFPVVAVVSPVPNRPDKRVIYMITIEKRTRVLTGGIEGGHTAVFDSKGRYLAHPNESKLLATRRGGADSEAVTAGLAGSPDSDGWTAVS